MRKKSVSLFLIMLFVFGLASCSPYNTVEDYFNSKPRIVEDLSKFNSSEHYDIQVKGNDIVCTCELSNTEGISEDAAFHESTRERIEQALDEAAPTYEEYCRSLEENLDIEDITITVEYRYNSELITQRTFRSN